MYPKLAQKSIPQKSHNPKNIFYHYPYGKEDRWYREVLTKQQNELVILRREVRDLRRQVPKLSLKGQGAAGQHHPTELEQQLVGILYVVRGDLYKADVTEWELIAHAYQNRVKELTTTKQRIQEYMFGHGNHAKKGSSGKKKGGQIGHAPTKKKTDTSNLPREQVAPLEKCNLCGNELRVGESMHTRILKDIDLTLTLKHIVVESFRQVCTRCGKEHYAQHSQSLPFTPYGLNTCLMVVVMRYQDHLPMEAIANTMNIFAPGLGLSKSVVESLLDKMALYLGNKYNELLELARQSDITYSDETGWHIGKDTAWVWFFGTEDISIYHAALSRGKGEFDATYHDSTSLCMTDAYGVYEKSIEEKNHLKCFAHALRLAGAEDPVVMPIPLMERTILLNKNSELCR